MAFFSKLKESLSRTKDSINSKLEEVINTFKTVDDDLFDELAFDLSLIMTLSFSLYVIPASVVFETTNLKLGFSASSRYFSKSSYGFTVLAMQSINFLSTVGTPSFNPRII